MARRSSQPLAEVRRQVLSHGRPTFQPVAHKLGLKSLKKPSFKTGTNLSKSTGSEKKARERTPTAETGSQPVNRSVRRATQFLGISEADPGPENFGPVEDGGGRGIRTCGFCLRQAQRYCSMSCHEQRSQCCERMRRNLRTSLMRTRDLGCVPKRD
jgi:hypothetical protein